MSQTAKAMTYSVLATLAVVLGWMALNPQQTQEFDPGVDVAAAEAEVERVAAFDPPSIDAPETWRANFARWESGEGDGIPAWNVGYLTDEEEFFGLSQTVNATPDWVEQNVNPLGQATQTSVANHQVTRWVGEDDHIYLVAEFDHEVSSDDDAQPAEAPEPSDTMTLIISGSMDEQTLHRLAAEIIDQYN